MRAVVPSMLPCLFPQRLSHGVRPSADLRARDFVLGGLRLRRVDAKDIEVESKPSIPPFLFRNKVESSEKRVFPL